MVSKTIEWNVSSHELVVGNVEVEMVDEGSTVLVFKFSMRGAGVTLSKFVDFVEDFLDELLEDTELGFVMAEVGKDVDYLSRSLPRLWAEYRISILKGKNNVKKRFEEL